MEAMFSSIPSIFSVRMESLLETSMRRSESWVSGGLVFLALGGMVAGRGERVEGREGGGEGWARWGGGGGELGKVRWLEEGGGWLADCHVITCNTLCSW